MCVLTHVKARVLMGQGLNGANRSLGRKASIYRDINDGQMGEQCPLSDRATYGRSVKVDAALSAFEHLLTRRKNGVNTAVFVEVVGLTPCHQDHLCELLKRGPCTR